MKLLYKNWIDQFNSFAKKSKQLQIISPFIKGKMIRNIEKHIPLNNVTIITRYDLRNFATGISDLEGLSYAVEKGATIYGIKGLHSKVYIFGESKAVISSANLTNGGLISNYECGIVTTDKETVTELQLYFINLCNIANNKLTITTCKEWQDKINVEPINVPSTSLPDLGASETQFDQSRNYYIKFFGTTKSRVSHDFIVRDEVTRAQCHYACTFSEKKKPKKMNDGDIVFMARMLKSPKGFGIFGRAEAIKYQEGRDRATENEIAISPWKVGWPIYLRVQHPVFVDTIMGNCVSLYDLINQFDYESFPSTQHRYHVKGQRNINAYRSLSQQAFITLTHVSAQWLEQQFQDTLETFGKVPDSFIEKLPVSDISI